MRKFAKYHTCIYRLYSLVDTTWKNIDLSKFELKVKYSMFIQLYNIYNTVKIVSSFVGAIPQFWGAAVYID